jgi:hypothetical protein
MELQCQCKCNSETSTGCLGYCFSLIICFDICSENAGLLALTHVGSRRVVQISAGFMIFFSVLGNTQLFCF